MDAVLELIPFLAIAVTGGVSYHLTLRSKTTILNWLWVVWFVLTVLLTIGYMTSAGWDAVLFLVMLAGISAPMAAGGLIGGLIGAVRRDNADPE